MKFSLSIAILLALGACSFQQTISEHAIGYNKTVAQAGDSQTLLNILRARDEQPMYFTAINDFSGQLEQTASSTLGVTVPVGGDAPSNFPFTSSLTVSESSKPLFKVNVLSNSPEFMNAVHAPVEMKTVKYFWDQGWPRDLLIYLLVEKIEVKSRLVENGGDERIVGEKFGFGDLISLETACIGVENEVVNDLNKENFDCFQGIVTLLTSGSGGQSDRSGMQDDDVELKLVTSLSGTPVGPEFEPNEARDLANLLKVKQDELDLVDLGTKFQLCRVEPEIRLCLSTVDCRPITSPSEACKRESAKRDSSSDAAGVGEPGPSDEDNGHTRADNWKDVSSEIAETGVQSFSLPPKELKSEDKPASFAETNDDASSESTVDRQVQFTAYLRSLQGMLYFAGELIREGNGRTIRVNGRPGATGCPSAVSVGNQVRIPLFQVHTGEPEAGSILVDHSGKTYWVKAGEQCSRSMQTMAFFSQILGLYQSRAELPGSTLVQTIDR